MTITTHQWSNIDILSIEYENPTIHKIIIEKTSIGQPEHQCTVTAGLHRIRTPVPTDHQPAIRIDISILEQDRKIDGIGESDAYGTSYTIARIQIARRQKALNDPLHFTFHQGVPDQVDPLIGIDQHAFSFPWTHQHSFSRKTIVGIAIFKAAQDPCGISVVYHQQHLTILK